MAHNGKLSRKAFWEAVEERLAGYSADDLRGILRAMAQDISPARRRDFLARLEHVGETDRATSPAIDGDALLDEIDDLGQEIKEMAEHALYMEERTGWGEYYDEEDSLGPYYEFVEPLVDLFAQAGSLFDHGKVSLARAAYARLFDLVSTTDEYGYGVSLSYLTGVDADEAVARYLRAVYETEPPAHRAQTLHGLMWHAPGRPHGQITMLSDLIQISPHPLPDQERFLKDWITYLRTKDGPSGSYIDTWLREAVRLAQGTSGLEELARAEGQTRPRVYLDWFTALEEEGKYENVLVAAQKALDILPAQLPIRAAIADHLGGAATELHKMDILAQARWAAFSAKPALSRMLDLWDITADPAERHTLMQRVVKHLRAYREHKLVPPQEVTRHADRLEWVVIVDDVILAHAYMLAKDWGAAYDLAKQGDVLGWSSTQNHQGLVIGAFLVLLSGQPMETLPPNLSQIWQWGVQNSITGSWTHGKEGVNDTRLTEIYTVHFVNAKLSSKRQTQYLRWCLEVTHQRVNAIVGNQYRNSYYKAAVLAVACAEMLSLRGDLAEAKAFMSEVQERFPRHRAFQSEVKGALQRMAGAGLG